MKERGEDGVQGRCVNNRRSKQESNGLHAWLADTSLHQRKQGIIYEYTVYMWIIHRARCRLWLESS